MRARSAMAGWSVETQRESKRPKAVRAERVHESRGTFTVRQSVGEGASGGGADFVYRVIYLVVDMSFECSTVCAILPELMGIWQKSTQPRSTTR